MIDVAANYRQILSCIADAAAKAGRDLRQIRLLAAAKAQSVEAIRAAVEAGVALVGENYVQEARQKKQRIDAPAEWHMIGHLQRNKVKTALEIFDLIESLDSVALARELDKEGRHRGMVVRAFVEVNLGGEESKSGVARDHVRPLIDEASGLSFLHIEGLMTVPPFRVDPEDVRPYFRELAAMRENLNRLRLSNVEIKELSMGMTHDYRIAVEEGATIVRIGTALFGARDR
jgi:PLP dependent protein